MKDDLYLLQVGDVIKADSSWIHGHRQSRSEVLGVGHGYRNVVRDVEGNILSQYDRTDGTRNGAYFVVESTGYTGGGTGHGPRDIYPDGRQVLARRLNDDHTYNPQGEVAMFYQTGCFSNMIKNPEVVGKMRQVITFEEVTTP